MLAMFLFLGGWFFKDASTGYRHENLQYLMHRSFASAAQLLREKQEHGNVTEQDWREFASEQSVDAGDDAALLPANTPNPLPWPEELRNGTASRPKNFTMLDRSASNGIWHMLSVDWRYTRRLSPYARADDS